MCCSVTYPLYEWFQTRLVSYRLALYVIGLSVRYNLSWFVLCTIRYYSTGRWPQQGRNCG
ncbi:hypothetical protein BJX64DRAFT_253811 [Aspergillus heterothallicus]